MTDKNNIVLIGGDERNREVISNLQEKKFQLFLAGFEQLSFHEKNIHHINMNQFDFSLSNAILLPVGGINKDGTVQASYSNSRIELTTKILNQTPEHCKIYTGISTPELDELTKASSREVITLFKRDDVAIMNSIPTAEGALKIAIEETDITIHGAEVLVIGYGRVGFTVAQLFHAVGANVSVAMRKQADAARARQLGLRPLMMDQLIDYSPKVDIWINTVPHLVLTTKVLSELDPSSLIIDLASFPGGTDFQSAQHIGIKAVHALGLPGKTASKSAGKILAEAFLSSYSNQI